MEDETMGIFGSLFGALGSTAREQAYREAYREAYEEMKRWVNSNTTAPKQWTNMNLTAANNAVIASNLQNTVYTTSVWPNTTISDPLQDIYDKVCYWASHMHPAYTGDIVEDLIKLSSSGDPLHRLMVAQHRLTPEACLIMMQNDSDSKVRESVEKVLRYNEDQQDG